MSITIKTPEEIAQEYLTTLKALRPGINTDQTDSDWWIRSHVIGGTLSGMYADLNRVSNDAFPQSARREAVDKHLQVYTGAGLRSATVATGNVGVTGNASGITVFAGTQFIHESTQNVYISNQEITLTTPTGSIPVISVVAGQAQNLLTDTSLTISSPPAGLTAIGKVLTPGIADGRDAETTDEGAARVLLLIRNPARGGTEADYKNWALAADSRVVSANIFRHVYGLGSVQVIISAGTSNIDDAIDNNLPINIIPSNDLRAAVLEYIDAFNPITDVVYVDAPIPITVNVTVAVAFESGNASTIIAGTTLTQGDAVRREVMRAIYKTPVGGRLVNGVALLRASDIEEQIDANLSTLPYTVGLKYQIVGDRQVSISGGTPNFVLAYNEVAIPGTITITSI